MDLVRPRMRVPGILAALCLAAFAALHSSCIAYARIPTEYEVKAAYLYNFARFVEWPEGAFPAPDSPLILVVLGDDPFGPALEAAFRDKQILDHPVVMKRLRGLNGLEEAQMVFISGSETLGMPRISAALGERGVLTVGDLPEMVTLGAVIGFRVEDDRVRFDVSAARAARSGLRLSSELLKVARTIDGVPRAQ